MKSPHFSMFLLIFVVLFSSSRATSAHAVENFLHCLSSLEDYSSIIHPFFTEKNATYFPILESSVQNPAPPEPLLIVTPLRISHIQATIHCSRQYQLQIRTRSKDHDIDDLSHYKSEVPFVIIDLVDFQSVDVDVENKVAWVQSGAILDDPYYRITEKSKTLSFPTGVCHAVGIEGYFTSCGGYASLFRKYGLTVENIIDAQLIDVNGKILDRKSMGEDLFWAIRGDGGDSFGVVLAWKVKLVNVPPTMTVFSVSRTLEENATKLVHRWQYVAPKLPDDIFSTIFITRFNSTEHGKRTILATFTSLFLGSIDELILLMQKRFPELGLMEKDCTEMSWIESLLSYGQILNESMSVLLDRSNKSRAIGAALQNNFFIKEPISQIALTRIWSKLYEKEAEFVGIGFVAYGGKMDEISKTETPFPHNAGNLYQIVNIVGWKQGDDIKIREYGRWIRKLYSHVIIGPNLSRSSS